MAHSSKVNNSVAGAKVTVRGGKLMETSIPGLYFVRADGIKSPEVDKDQMAGPILRKLAKVFNKPGIPPEVVFGENPPPNFYAYSVDPTDFTRMVRKDVAGNRTIGTMVNGKFRKLSAKA